jgi:hypothetical protein
MFFGGTQMRAAVRLLTCACLLLAFTGLAATPLAGLLPGQGDCNCGCQHENGKRCCCRRAAHEAGAKFESAAGCPGKCGCSTAVPLRVGLFLPHPTSSAAAVLPVVSRTTEAAAQFPPDSSLFSILRDRSPPLAANS